MIGSNAALLAATLAGLLAGGHCLAMCGAISAALAHAVPTGPGRRIYPVWQGLGRVASYTVIGGLAGTFGAGVGALAPAPQVRVAVQLLGALAIALVGLRLLGAGDLLGLERLGAVAWRRVAPIARGLLPIHSVARALLAGALWGWLPCGLSWGMALAAAGSGDAAAGALTMTMFGLGTLPATLGAAYGAHGIGRLGANPRLRRAGGVAIVLLALGAAAAPWLLSHSAHDGHVAQGSGHAADVVRKD